MSPIKGLSEQTRLPRLGKIHLGVKVKGRETEYPQPVDYFVCPPELSQFLGEDKPTQLTIVFPTDNPDQWASHFYRAYTSYRGLVCRGDGETATRMVDLDRVVDPKTGEVIPKDEHPNSWPRADRDTKRVAYYEIACPGPACPEFQRKGCRPVMNLQFLIPNYPRLGIWQIDTSSWNSMRNVLSGVRLVKSLLEGRVSGIPLTLSLVPMQVQPEGVKKNVHVLQLTAPYSLLELYERAKLPRAEAVALPPPDLEAPEDLFPDEEEPTVVEGKIAKPASFFQPPGEPPSAPAVEISGEAALDQAGVTSASAPPPAAQAEPPAQKAPPRLLEVWEEIRASLKALPGGTERQAAKWLAKESGIEVSTKVFERPAPPVGLPGNVLFRLAQELKAHRPTLR